MEPDKKRPWMKFFPSDWSGDRRLHMCSVAARGLWIEIMCVMHEAEPYGFLVTGGKPVTKQQIAALAGIPLTSASKLLAELESAGVFSRDEHGVIYSRRMVRDKAKAERDRENGKGGGNPRLKKMDNLGVNPPDMGQDKAQRLEARIDDEDDARARESGKRSGKLHVDLTAELMVISGHPPESWPPGWHSGTHQVEKWLNAGWQVEVILDTARDVMARRAPGSPPVNSPGYFEKAIAEATAKLAQPLPEVLPAETIRIQPHARDNARRRPSLSDIARRQAESGIDFGPRPTGLPEPASSTPETLTGQQNA